MKYLKKFENVDFDIDFVLSKIKEKFNDDNICDMVDQEILEWTDDEWSEDYDSEYDWYVDHNNREAEDVVIEQIVSWYEKKYKPLSNENRLVLIDKLSDVYRCV